MIKLSIITINLNNIKGLVRTFQSVFDQEGFDSFEYIVVDGASTDGSIELIEENTTKINYWISESDTGVYQAMNKGIERAKGTHLLFLNSGDILANKTVLRDVFSTEHSEDIFACGCILVQNQKKIHTIIPSGEITFGFLYFKGLNHQSTFIKKDLFTELGLYDDSYKYHGDIEFWYRAIILNGATTKCISVILTEYNLEGISSLNGNNPDFKAENERIFNHPLLQKFVPDYANWRQELEQNKILLWAKSKKILYATIKLSFKVSHIFSKLNRK